MARLESIIANGTTAQLAPLRPVVSFQVGFVLNLGRISTDGTSCEVTRGKITNCFVRPSDLNESSRALAWSMSNAARMATKPMCLRLISDRGNISITSTFAIGFAVNVVTLIVTEGLRLTATIAGSSHGGWRP